MLGRTRAFSCLPVLEAVVGAILQTVPGGQIVIVSGRFGKEGLSHSPPLFSAERGAEKGGQRQDFANG